MRVEEDKLIIEYTDVILMISPYIRNWKFHRGGQMPRMVEIEIPMEAYDATNVTGCPMEAKQVEGTPPTEWFHRAIKSAEHAAPAPVELASAPQRKIHHDEMYVEREAEDSKLVEHGENSLKAPKEEDIETVGGGITEDVRLAADPTDGLADYIPSTIPQSEEGAFDNAGDSEASIPDGLERASEHERALAAIDTADSPTSEPDGDE